MFKYNFVNQTGICFEMDAITRAAVNDMLNSNDDNSAHCNHTAVNRTKTCSIDSLLQRILNFDIRVVEPTTTRVDPNYRTYVNYNSYTNEELTAASEENLIERYINSPYNEEEYRTLNLSFVKRGLGLYTIIAKQRPATQPEKNLEIALQQNQYHRLIIRKFNNAVCVISNQELKPEIIAKLQLLPYIWWDKIGQYPMALSLLQACFDAKDDVMDTCIQNILKKYTASQKDRVYTQLSEAIKNRQNGRITALKQDISNTQNTIEGTMTNLRNYQNTLQKYQEQLTGILTTPTQDDVKFMDFMKNNKVCKLIALRDGRLVLDIIAPIRSYADRDVQIWFRHPEQQNTISRYANLSTLVKACFIDKEYTMYCGTRVYLPIDGSTNNWGRCQPMSNWMGNPHLVHYNCFGETRNAVQHSIRADGDFLTAINQTIAACSTLVFTDSTVIEAFSTDLRNSSSTYKLFKDNKTGDMLSMQEIIEIKEVANAQD